MPPPDDRPPDPQAAWQKAATIGAPGIGSRYLTPLNPTTWDLIKAFLGGERPQTVAAQDPYGIKAWEAGKGPPPMLFGTTEPVEALTPLKALTTGKAAATAAAREAAPGIRGYHGSGADFPPEPGAPLGRFRAEKIGTGEGAQAYGHGLYIAEHPGTAETYYHALSDDAIKFADGRVVKPSPGSIEDRALAFLATYSEGGFGIDNPHRFARSEVEKLIKYGTGSNRPGEMETLQKVKDVLREWEHTGVTAGKSGKRYEVNIEAHLDDFLDWDKPLSEQSPKVREALLDAMKKRGLPLDEAGVPLWAKSDPSGESMHAALSAVGQSNREGQALGANLLKESGIPGIKYLDQGSRAAGEGSRNFVVFDDKLISILRKYGLLPPIAAGTLGLSQLARPSPPEAR